ncbi:MAG: type II toxin-antitoxin system RelE/ParE family toxin [Candidatus Woesearchaeota archaeon]|nr:type II toxin-antitoxin system RelE/ParE family toxin [Candidatus Woesearchaeota archaeon]
MVNVNYDPHFKKKFSKIKDQLMKDKIIKQVSKLKDNPELGKPMKYTRKGTRELYISPYRLSYIYIEKENLLIFLDLYHKYIQ